MNLKIIILSILIIIPLGTLADTFECVLPRGCRAKKVNEIDCMTCNEVNSRQSSPGFECQARARTPFQFKLASWNISIERLPTNSCSLLDPERVYYHVRFPRTEQHLLTKSFNMHDFYRFVFFQLRSNARLVRFSNLKGIDVDLGVVSSSIDWPTLKNVYKIVSSYELVDSKFEFYSKSKPIKSCRDLIGANNSTKNIDSLIQIPSNNYLTLMKCRFRRPVCPILFKNARFHSVKISRMSDYFYKKSVLTFGRLADGQQQIDLNAKIYELNLYRVENILLDETFLQPEIFKHLIAIKIFGSVREISANVFKNFKQLNHFRTFKVVWRRLMHNKVGIEWIRSFNNDLNIDWTNLTQVIEYKPRKAQIAIDFEPHSTIEDGFPDKDFCLYVNFPFEKLVLFNLDFRGPNYHYIDAEWYHPRDWVDRRPSCTFHWVSRHFLTMSLTNINNLDSARNLTAEFKRLKSECGFEKRLNLCNRTHFWVGTAGWDYRAWKKFNMFIRFFIDISIHPISFFGILTNSLVIFIISAKTNNDIFKGFRQYTFLKAISVFNIGILTIQILSWMGQCSETLDFYCPITRKIVAVEFFRIIFKEYMVIVLRFMTNFSYVAFALNRISLIGQDHIKLVEYMTRVKLKKFFLVTSFLSLILSLSKAFRYQVNYDRSENSYPTSLESDLTLRFSFVIGTYFVSSVISDFLNYFVFLAVNLGIDIYMLIRLRNTLKDKADRFNDNGNKQLVDQPKSNDKKNVAKINKEKIAKKTMRNAIKMVIFNSALNILFKFPLLIMPTIYVLAAFYFHSQKYMSLDPAFYDFRLDNLFGFFDQASFFSLFTDLSDWLFTILITIQLLFYIRFDKKINSAWKRFVDCVQQKIVKLSLAIQSISK